MPPKKLHTEETRLETQPSDFILPWCQPLLPTPTSPWWASRYSATSTIFKVFAMWVGDKCILHSGQVKNNATVASECSDSASVARAWQFMPTVGQLAYAESRRECWVTSCSRFSASNMAYNTDHNREHTNGLSLETALHRTQGVLQNQTWFLPPLDLQGTRIWRIPHPCRCACSREGVPVCSRL